MSIWQICEVAAWAASAAIALFMVVDAVRVSMRFDEEFLTHSLDDPLAEVEIDSAGQEVALDQERTAAGHEEPRNE